MSGLLWARFSAEWLVVLGGVEGALPEQFTGFLVHDAEGAVGDEGEDSGLRCSGEGTEVATYHDAAVCLLVYDHRSRKPNVDNDVSGCRGRRPARG
jgi:hypothetical protein